MENNLELFEKLIACGDSYAALEQFRKFAKYKPSDAETQYKLGVMEEQVGDMGRALQAYKQALKLAPNNYLIYLYLGYCCQINGHTEEAAAYYSLGDDFDIRLRSSHLFSDIDPETKRRSLVADKHLRSFLSDQHRHLVGKKQETINIYNAIWVQTHDRPIDYQATNQQPQLFYVNSIPPKAVVIVNEAQWCKRLEMFYSDIKQELFDAQDALDELKEPYLKKNIHNQNFSSLINSSKWSAIYLYENGRINSRVAAHFPNTLKLLKQVPTYGLDEAPYEVFFSVLSPRQKIPPHFGLSNHSLTVHLPLDIPAKCQICIDQKWMAWREGHVLAFDDSFEHQVKNASNKKRVVLIFSIWQPALTNVEKQAIQKAFKERQMWVKNRSAIISQDN